MRHLAHGHSSIGRQGRIASILVHVWQGLGVSANTEHFCRSHHSDFLLQQVTRRRHACLAASSKHQIGSCNAVIPQACRASAMPRQHIALHVVLTQCGRWGLSFPGTGQSPNLGISSLNITCCHCTYPEKCRDARRWWSSPMFSTTSSQLIAPNSVLYCGLETRESLKTRCSFKRYYVLATVRVWQQAVPY